SELYQESLTKFEFSLVEGTFQQAGDSFFAFLVPEASLEDNQVVIEAVRTGLFSAHFAASILMVDFPNPVFSPARAKLLTYVPQSVSLANGRDVSAAIADPIVAAAVKTGAGSPEQQFATNWSLAPNAWQATFAARIESYMTAVNARSITSGGFD